MLLAADGRATTSGEGAFHSDSALKVLRVGRRSACAIGGNCEVIVADGPRKGQHWKLLDSLRAVRHFPSTSSAARAQHLFDAAYAAAADWLPHDTDAAPLGKDDRGIVVLYAEVSSDSSVNLFRADMPVTVSKNLDQHYTWSVNTPVVRKIVPGEVALPMIYFHS